MGAMPITPTRERGRAHWTPLVTIVGRSMEPTLRPGAVALTRRRPALVQRGRVVLLRGRDGQLLVKRVVARGGDVVEMEAGRLRVNGVVVDGGASLPGARVTRWEVPAGHYFVVGDNPAASIDSRVWADPFVAHDRVAGVLTRWSTRPVARRRGW